MAASSTSAHRQSPTLVLGLDIGTNSVGWALVEERGGVPRSLHAAGVRVFPAGMEISEQTGKADSHAVERRLARQRRRMLDRRKRRRRRVLHLLQKAGFLPAGAPKHDEPAWAAVLRIDPYQARAEGLDRQLAPFEFGRAIFHITHRRGFQSNRKQAADPKDVGKVRVQTDAQAAEMQRTGARTFGEFLWKLRLGEPAQRLRERYTQRQWYRDEFTALCEAQERLKTPGVERERVAQLKEAIFYQRPLKVRKSLIGKCSLEPNRYRAATALLTSQRFRLLQDVNHACLVDEAGRETPLAPEQRQALIAALETSEKLTFAKARKLVRAPRGMQFNLEQAEREAFTGNSTAARIVKAIGIETWQGLDDAARGGIVEGLMSMEDRDALCSLLQRKWSLPLEAAEALADVDLEDGHMRLSSKAIGRLLPHLEQGRSYTEAVMAAYPNRAADPAVERLPPVPKDEVRNPVVQRSLAETRRVVNAIVARHGKPARIRIELARDLRKTAKAREAAYKSMRGREKERRLIAQKMLEEAQIQEPKPHEIEKALLWQECCGTCPYTGRGIPFQSLFGQAGDVHVEHIIPFSRSLDNSFANKTLCYAEENVHVKHNRTPFEAYASDKEKWEAILGRVRKLTGGYRAEKLRRFLLEDAAGDLEGFCTADLNDTRYAARYASTMVARLYAPEERRRRIQVSVGQTTAYLRSAWRLNDLLSPTNRKTREDHRHHAVDALAIALTTPATTKALADASSSSYRPGVFPDVPLPWDGLRTDLAAALEGMVVSHRVDHKVNGPMHKESFYGLIRVGRDACRTVLRTKLSALSEKDVGRIVDKAVREAVQAKLQQLDGKPEEVFQNPANLPHLTTAKGKAIRIRRVRIFRNENTVPLGVDNCRRVQTRDNHHLEVFAVHDGQGEPRWEGHVVSRMEAMTRRKLKLPILPPQDAAGNPLALSLAIGDAVRLLWQDRDVLAVVQKLSDGDFGFRLHNDARKAQDLGDEFIRIRSTEKLRLLGCRRIRVSPLGETDA